jgi:hypothetical protein
MKFLCLECDEQMAFAERREPGDGTFAASFTCPRCGHTVALLANPMETQLVGALGVRIGGRELDEQPMEFVRRNVVGRDDAFADREGDAAEPAPERRAPVWSTDAQERLSRVPSFVRGMVKRIYTEYARERGLMEITPEVMDRARSDLGLEGM